MRHVILDAQDPTDEAEAFVVCDAQLREVSRTDGLGVLRYGHPFWTDARLWCFSLPDLRRKRPGMFEYTTLYSILSLARERGYPGPESVAAVAEWAGVAVDSAALPSPLYRCQLLGAVLRSPRVGLAIRS